MSQDRERSQQRVVIRFLHKERVSPDEILAAQPCKDLHSKRNFDWCCAQFVGRRDAIDDGYCSGRPPIEHPETKILACLESERFQGASSLDETLTVSRATVLNRLHNSLRMKNCHVRWVPHQSTSELQARRLAKCRELLRMLEALQKNNVGKVVTGDESWFYLETGHSAQRSVCRDDVATKTKPMTGTPKFMLTVMSGRKGFHVADLMTSQNQFDPQYFLEHIKVPLGEEITLHSGNRRALRLHVHLDNCRVHFSKVAEQFFEANDILGIPRPYCGLDLVLSDFWYSGVLRPPSRGKIR
jgi:hypothetical protein